MNDDKDALLVENERLRQETAQLWVALRQVVVKNGIGRCSLCGHIWSATADERHAPGCLAAPK